MIRPVIGTIGARVVITAANLLLIAMVGRALGAEGLGTISLIVLGISIILLMAHVVGGGGLVYLVPRHGVASLLLPAYGWAVVTALVALIVVGHVRMAPEGFAMHVVALAFLQALNSIHLNIMVAKERIGTQNTLLVLQGLVQVAGFAVLLNSGGATLMDYVGATYLAYGLTALLSGGMVVLLVKRSTHHPVGGSLRALVHQGGIGQLANLFQLFNYRAAYYLIETLRGTASLGVYSVAMQLAEGSWLVPKSIGGVLYSKVSNLEHQRRQVQLTTILFKISVLFGMACALALVVLPDTVYSGVFGKEVRGLRPILLLIAPGLVAMSGSQVLSHYLSGTGHVRHNMIGSGLGLVVTLVLGWPSIANYGLVGAAFTASVAYTTSLCYQVVVFLRHTHTRIIVLVPGKGDLRMARSLWHKYRNAHDVDGSYI